MAEKKDLDHSYTTFDEIFRLSMGETGDITGAKYDGDFSMTLEEAQRAKHKFVADSLHIKEGSRVLDMGCGWGPFLNYIDKERGANSIGLTLSDGQAEACKKNGLNVFIKDCRYVKPDDYGVFDSIVCIGGLEHFCSIEEYKKGNQEKVYSEFFKTAYDLLPKGGRLYVQTMVFGKNMIEFEKIDINAPRGSIPRILALMIKLYPGSWLPYLPEMVVRYAEPGFKLISKSNGRLDYIQTMNEWKKRYLKFNLKKYLLALSCIPRFIFDKEFRYWIPVFFMSPNRLSFEKELFDHYRLVFEKV